MSFFGSRPATSSSGDNGSLTKILPTPRLRTELVLLVALISDTMRRDVLSTFDADATGPSRVNAEPNLLDLSDEEQDETSAIRQELKEAKRRREIDILSSRTQGLRRAALTYFDKWQVDVLRRLGEVLSVRPDAIRKGRADAKARAESAAQARKDKDFFAWANGDDPIADESLARPEQVLVGLDAEIPRMEKSKRVLLLDSVLLLLLSLEHYTAHSRVLMVKLTAVLDLPGGTLIDHESKLAEALLSSAASQMEADEATKNRANEDAVSKRWKIGLATVAGAALIGVSGGLAAPFLAASAGHIMGGLGLGAVASLLGPLATNVFLVGGLFGAYGGRMTGRIMEKYAQEVEDFKFLPVAVLPGEYQKAPRLNGEAGFEELKNEENQKLHKLRVAIGVSGWLTDTKEIVSPWQVFSSSKVETFALQWEVNALLQLGKSVSSVLADFAWDFARFQVLSALIAGLWPFGLLSAASVLDNPFIVAKTRSDKAGKVLADALINRVQGERPVTLVGYSLGARVIYSCLLELADQNAFGLVDSVVLMGGPVPSDSAPWRRIRAIVSGRVVNVYSKEDFTLGFLYRASSAQLGIAGLEEVVGISRIENYDFTDMIKGHSSYGQAVGSILQRVGFEDLDMEAVRRQKDQFVANEQAKQAEKSAASEQQQQPAKQEEGGQIVMVDDEALEKQRKQKAKVSERASQVKPDDGLSARTADLDLASGEANSKADGEADDEIDGDAEHDIRHTIELEDEEGSVATGEMTLLEPEALPDTGPERETVRFGSGIRGFNVEWDSRHENRSTTSRSR